ncbi:hypothetical protein KKF32_01440 [Patescibacteria group bacterium]|nr:hypothetical protein [Patescibacteria group bacterium]
MSKPKEIDFGFVYEYPKIWKLDIPSEEMPITELEFNLDIAYLEKEGTDDWNLTLRELINFPEKEPSHYKKIKNAQLEYPIGIYFFRGSWKILDGVHRFCKAVMEGKKTISVRKITDEMIPDILKKAT